MLFDGMSTDNILLKPPPPPTPLPSPIQIRRDDGTYVWLSAREFRLFSLAE